MTPKQNHFSANSKEGTKNRDKAANRAEQNRRAQRLYRQRKEARVRELESIIAEMKSAAASTPTPRELELLERIKQLEDENTTLWANQHTYPSYGHHPYLYPYYQNPYWNYYPQSEPGPAYHPLWNSMSVPNPSYHTTDESYPRSNAKTLQFSLLELQSLASQSELVNEFCETLIQVFNQTQTGYQDSSAPANNYICRLWIRMMIQRLQILSRCDDNLDRPAALSLISDYLFGEHCNSMIIVANNLLSTYSATQNQPKLAPADSHIDAKLESEIKLLSSLQNDLGLVQTYFREIKDFLETHKWLNNDIFRLRLLHSLGLQIRILLLCSSQDRITMEFIIDRYRKKLEGRNIPGSTRFEQN
ncbi:hypothetical protein BCR33DRAFT_859803 [Rhizoclosmatium globosum]|uniref:BZIP domain-containing protein n=1 Tax=Rhizoclosmatium globosum TaxID=329046 RepID=A0A1Y2ATF3_9FUNG|nr:hypothetical protein BCR33DRAFT_859803 [Rhizoclosmatium globosum]|eukprot:ORY25487.1 hypothetical protein BCR33DRAFT_859803 [Rhizoclosmatium globosum]